VGFFGGGVIHPARFEPRREDSTPKPCGAGIAIEVVGSFAIRLADYHVDVPQTPFTQSSPDATVEVRLFLSGTERGDFPPPGRLPGAEAAR